MFYRRQGYPEEDEIVLCKVSKIFPNAVFVDLLEYQQNGIIHISEVSPGRIRNLRDFVEVDRQIVCKILRIDREKGHLDLSLRRVNSNQRRDKLEEIKNELKSEQLISNLATKLKRKSEDLYKEVSQKIFKDYSHLYLCFKEVAVNETSLEEIGIDQSLSKELTQAIIDKFKPRKVILSVEIKLQTYDSNGIQKIKQTLHSVEKTSPSIKISYLGAGRYKVYLEDEDFKKIEKNYEQIEEIVTQFNDKISTGSVEREKAEEE